MIKQFQSLKSYCESQNFAGWDPYDGLNSKIFKALPLKKWDLARLVWIQGFKRSPINFRKLFLVPKQHNAKGLGLFLNGYCNLYKMAELGNTSFGTKEDIYNRITYLANLLLEMQNTNYSGACWGYNFDWQARRLFLFPAHTPTVVATTFCASALFEAYEITKEEKYLTTALSAAKFILNDLNRTQTEGGFILSYSPLKGNDTVYNASLLGAKTLSYCYHYTRNEEYKNTAEQIIKAACDGQSEDGSWVYGLLPVQSWIDSFHTGYNLDAIAHYQKFCSDYQFEENLERGFDFYIKNFFLEDGTPKYYHNKTYPIDIHCPGQLFVTLHALQYWTKHSELADQVVKWTLEHMFDKKGYFYYQLKEGISSKIPYMRWSNAFMFNALSIYLLNNTKDGK
ncbi:MAG: delta-aminolevulinic acid dehydratase [Fluviicola sp.]|jgi:rhamnogalacturonyl hydrolase YesR|uniref:delta-aminolevulinic acid dehydratase n=1 Tax=Fluviicola sp. TaxID=1917219 RepID=UPI00262C1763|nr:delta-aminolevulinic acid dehydratase [Fluviicola sp.]MDF3028507.1 delta-aminolevulinic acid dehydratase [Fluviicola sp.]